MDGITPPRSPLLEAPFVDSRRGSNAPSEEDLVLSGFTRSAAQRAVFERNDGCIQHGSMCWRASPGVLLLLATLVMMAMVYMNPNLILLILILQPILCLGEILLQHQGERRLRQAALRGPLCRESMRPAALLRAFVRCCKPRRYVRECWHGRARYLRRAAYWARRLVLLSLLVVANILLLLFVCYNSGGLFIYIILQPLLIMFAMKMCLDPNFEGDLLGSGGFTGRDPLMARDTRCVPLAYVEYDPELFDDVQLPRACVVCLQDFDGSGELLPGGTPSRARALGRNVVLVDGREDWAPGAIVRLPCERTHCFHAACVSDWLQDRPSCPLCRAEIDSSTAALARL